MWDEFVRELDAGTPEATRTCLETLHVYARNVAQHGAEEKYRRINTRNEKFRERVWQYEGAHVILFASGWEETDDGFLTLPPTVSADVMEELAHVIERHIRQKYGPPKVVKPPKAPGEPMTQAEREKMERDERVKEERRKLLEAAEEDRRKREALKQQIEADRKANAKRHSQASVARTVKFGGGCKATFADIGVDLNKGG